VILQGDRSLNKAVSRGIRDTPQGFHLGHVPALEHAPMSVPQGTATSSDPMIRGSFPGTASADSVVTTLLLAGLSSPHGPKLVSGSNQWRGALSAFFVVLTNFSYVSPKLLARNEGCQSSLRTLPGGIGNWVPFPVDVRSGMYQRAAPIGAGCALTSSRFPSTGSSSGVCTRGQIISRNKLLRDLMGNIPRVRGENIVLPYGTI
jgi:hypothetical protein